jgi:hypothetical protein
MADFWKFGFIVNLTTASAWSTMQAPFTGWFFKRKAVILPDVEKFAA